MNLFDWLRSWSRKQPPEAPKLEEAEQHFMGLDVQAVINAHLAWRKRLEDCILDRSNEELDIGLVMQDNQCALGQWLYGKAARSTLALHPEFGTLRETHRVFHLYAARIVQTLRMRGVEAAQVMLESEFDRLSKDIVYNLAALMHKERTLH
ncbi:MAG: CZB domain-containing protein [Meiothermus sp.]|uniref:CZB domain-containing protein n=1 Tax=Meiothermus sp. TaxID=1955249 RepID=UPI0025FDC062|nr:CZB domain-containing protein [Meiothermus sp.]MCS7067863.1 CZB domain-containing protein [Meiothermus sp.]MDW8424747.1 CZB domain-containing protein [Meiothermus sp.]